MLSLPLALGARSAHAVGAEVLDVSELEVPKPGPFGRKCLVLRPSQVPADVPLPLVVLLHGLGETGSETLSIRAWYDRYGLPEAYARLLSPPVLRTLPRERYLSDVVTRCSLILAVYGRPHSPDCACSEHRSLIGALRRRDADAAVALMGQHLAGIESRALIAELPREGHALGDVLARYRDDVKPPASPLPTPRRRTA